MTDRLSRVYMDANAIVDTLKADQFESAPKIKGALTHEQPYFIDNFKRKKLHLEYCAKLFKAARNRKNDLLTSTLTLAEVWHLGIKPPSEEDKRIIDSVLTSGNVFKLIPDSYFIGRRARDLMWIYGIELTGADAIHVASALEASCDEFITNDPGIHAAAEKLKAQGLLVITADQTTSLPDSYHNPLLDTPVEAKAMAAIEEIADGQFSVEPPTDDLPRSDKEPDYTEEDDEEVTSAVKAVFDEIVAETERDD